MVDKLLMRGRQGSRYRVFYPWTGCVEGTHGCSEWTPLHKDVGPASIMNTCLLTV